jgi:hypothetical protein
MIVTNKTEVYNEIGYFDKYGIGEEIGLLDKIQTDNVVESLLKDGFVNNDAQSSKIRITEECINRLRNNQIANLSFGLVLISASIPLDPFETPKLGS